MSAICREEILSLAEMHAPWNEHSHGVVGRDGKCVGSWQCLSAPKHIKRCSEGEGPEEQGAEGLPTRCGVYKDFLRIS